jgi:nicotinate-nucleotide adenylyltransferase
VSQTIAVYGGSFDPPHIAHTLVCAYVLCAHGVDLVLVVPAGQHPFDKPLSPFEHRLRMCEIALRDLKRVEISSIERDLEGPSLTLRTLEHVQRKYPNAALRLVIGSDLLPETPSWHRFDRICELAPPIVVQRAGFELASADLPALPDLSSTEARRRLRAGLATEGLLDPEVADYARKHALYR